MADLLKQDPITGVQIEALTVVKILKQCSQSYPSTTTGFLVGMDVQGVLQLTNAYPFPVSAEAPTESNHYDNQQQNSSGANAAAPRKKENIAYQNEMVRNLREVNIDANTVGWYTSANMGNFINLNFIENQFFYQRDLNERTVAIVNDVARSSLGSLSLRAFRLSPAFMTAFKENQFTTEILMKSGLRPSDILVELPVRIHNSHLLTTFLHQLPVPIPDKPLEMPLSVSEIQSYADSAPLVPNLDTFDLSIDPFLEKTTDLLLDSIETHHVELNNFGYYQRALNREQAKIAAWQSKRKSENATRTITKQPLLPEDEWQRLFKLPTEPSRLEVMLNTRQVEQYSKQVDAFTANVSAKLFAVKGNLFPGGDEA